jgi:hypothetical protein
MAEETTVVVSHDLTCFQAHYTTHTQKNTRRGRDVSDPVSSNREARC